MSDHNLPEIPHKENEKHKLSNNEPNNENNTESSSITESGREIITKSKKNNEMVAIYMDNGKDGDKATNKGGNPHEILNKEKEKGKPSNNEPNNENNTENSSITKCGGEIIPKATNKSEMVAIDIDNGKDGDKATNKGVKKDFLIFGYYVRKPIWLYYESYGGGVDYQSSRNSFIRVVFLLDVIMLLITGGFVLLVLNSDDLMDFFEDEGTYLFFAATGVMLGMNYAMACSACTRKRPCNIICLIVSVVCMSIIVAYISVRYDTELLMFAFFATAIVVLCCCLLALSPIDFTRWYLYVIVIALALFAVFIIIMLAESVTGKRMSTVHLVLLVVMTLVNCIILTIEIQSVLGGRSMELDESDYALGAYLIYMSVINLFLQIARILDLFDDI